MILSDFSLAVNNFQQEASKVQFDLTGDSEEMNKLSNQIKKWDRKKKKMVVINKVSKYFYIIFNFF